MSGPSDAADLPRPAAIVWDWDNTLVDGWAAIAAGLNAAFAAFGLPGWTVEEVKADMRQVVPMDRLVCGDVGYGKTEIAVRAAFKAVQDGKQVVFACNGG